jgi:hypothetical protein
MNKQLDDVLRAAGRITGESQFIIIGSQSLHASRPDLPDQILGSVEVNLIAAKNAERTEWLNAIGVHSQFHETYGYYADPVEVKTATLPQGWRDRLIELPPGDTEGVRGMCLEPHDLAIAKYVANREKDRVFVSELARRGITSRIELLSRLAKTQISRVIRDRILALIEADFTA